MQGLLILFLVDTFDPLFNAFEVHRNAAATASPYVVFTSKIFRADNTVHFMVTALSFDESRSI